MAKMSGRTVSPMLRALLLRYQLSGCAGHAMDNESELVLENPAVLHDQVEICGRICHQIQVSERISVDQDQVA